MSSPAGSAGGFHPPLRHIPAASVDADTAQTPGMHRFAAISRGSVGSQRLWMGQTHVQPGMTSGDHHHGEAETAIYVVSGHPEFVFVDEQSRQEVRLVTGPGDYVFVPPYTPHREENNDPHDEAIVIIARSTQEAIVVNLESLAPTEAG
ncbi:MAG: cupin domain-containing protein [Jatrophihabitans sp.]